MRVLDVLVRRGSRPAAEAVTRDAGMTTAEYAVGTIAACAFGALLYRIVTSGPVEAALSGLLERALSVSF